MTDNRADDPRFAFIPKSAWDVLLDLAPIPLACIAVCFSLRFVAGLVCVLIWAFEFGPVCFIFGWRDAIPTTFAWATGIYFVLATVSRRRERDRGMACEGFGRSALLVFSGMIIVLLLLAFWCLDAHSAPWPAKAPAARFEWYTVQLEWYDVSSVCLGGAWAAGIVTAFALRRLGKRFEVLCLLPPVACIAGMLGLALADAPGGKVALELGLRLSHHPIFLVAILPTACSLPAIFWAECRLFQSSQRAIGVACANVWAIATVMCAIWSWPAWRRIYWGYSSRPPGNGLPAIGTAFETHVAIGIALAFFLAAWTRLWVSKRRVAAMAAKPADD